MQTGPCRFQRFVEAASSLVPQGWLALGGSLQALGWLLQGIRNTRMCLLHSALSNHLYILQFKDAVMGACQQYGLVLVCYTNYFVRLRDAHQVGCMSFYLRMSEFLEDKEQNLLLSETYREHFTSVEEATEKIRCADWKLYFLC